MLCVFACRDAEGQCFEPGAFSEGFLMTRRTLLMTLTAIGLCVLPTLARAEDAAGTLRAIYWSSGTHHDYPQITRILKEALPKLMKVDLRVVKDGAFLDTTEAKDVDVIIMNHCYEEPKGILTEKQQQTLLDWVKGGVGVVSVHASYYSFVKWDEIHKFSGARFTVHGSAKAIVLVATVDKAHPIMKDLPECIEVISELYESTPLEKGCHVLAMAREKGKDKSHPSVWTRMYGQGRVVTILPGHWPENYANVDFQKLIARSALWAGKHLPEEGAAK